MNEYKNKTILDINKSIAEKRDAIRNFRFGGSNKTKNVKSIKMMRKDIARMMTEISLRSKVQIKK